jgi:hypothetical protein
LKDGSTDGWYLVGQGHFAPVAGPGEGKTIWTALVAARLPDRKHPRGRLPLFGEPDVYNSRPTRPGPSIPNYRVHVSQQEWFGSEVYFLQGGEYPDPSAPDSFNVTVQIPYPSQSEAESVESSLGDKGKSVRTLMDFLLHCSERGYTVCKYCDGFGSNDDYSVAGCAACSGLGVFRHPG